MEAINRVGNFAIALINDSSVGVKKARANHKKTDFSKGLILVDNLGVALKYGTSDDFDYNNEIKSYNSFYKQVFTFDFYGDNAYELATRFIALLRTQRSYDLQTERGLKFYYPTNLVRLDDKIGETYFKRYQTEVEVLYSDNVELETLRIDTAQIELTFVEE